MNSNLLTLFGKMYQDSCLPRKDETSLPYSLSWTGSGLMADGELLMLSSSESPSSDDGFLACSLADILEPNAPLKYSLSPKAAAGVLRRAAKRGRELPEPLLRALIQVASMGKTPTPVTLSSPDH